MAISNGYVTLAEARDWLALSDADDDTLLERVIEASCRAIDAHCARKFNLDTNATARVYRAASPLLVITDDIGTLTGLVLKTDDDDDGSYETTWDSADYQVEPANWSAHSAPITRLRILDGYLPCSHRYSVQVTAKWGYPSVPVEIKQATLMLAARFYKRKDSPHGMVSFNDFAMRVTALDYDVLALANPFRRTWIA